MTLKVTAEKIPFSVVGIFFCIQCVKSQAIHTSHTIDPGRSSILHKLKDVRRVCFASSPILHIITFSSLSRGMRFSEAEIALCSLPAILSCETAAKQTPYNLGWKSISRKEQISKNLLNTTVKIWVRSRCMVNRSAKCA